MKTSLQDPNQKDKVSQLPPCTILQEKQVGKTRQVVMNFPAEIRDRLGLQGGMVITFPPVGYKQHGEITGGVFAKASPEIAAAYKNKRNGHTRKGQKQCVRCRKWNPIDAQFCIKCGRAFSKQEKTADKLDLKEPS